MIAPGGPGARRFETRHEMAVVEHLPWTDAKQGKPEPLVMELVEIDPGIVGVEPWYVIRSWRASSPTVYPRDVAAPLNRAQAGLLWREATGGMEIGDGERAAAERDLKRRRRKNRRVAVSLSLFFAGCAAMLAGLVAVELGMYLRAVASTGAGGLALWMWCGIEEGWL